MKITFMNDKNKDFFTDMDPLLFLEREELKNRLCLVAAMEDEETGFDDPAGVLLISQEKDRLVFEWLYVKEEYRARGVGEKLLLAGCDAAVQQGLPYGSAMVSRDPDRELICPQDAEYLREHLFLYEEPLAGEWAGELRMLKPLKEKGKKPKFPVRTLDSVGKKELSEFLTRLDQMEEAVRLYPMADTVSELDASVSVVLFDEQNPAGALLFKNCGDTLYPVCFYAESEHVAAELLEAFLEAAGKKYSGSKEIRVIKYGDRYNDLLRRVLPVGHTESMLYTCHLDEYIAMRNRTAAEKEEEDELGLITA